MGGVHLLEGLDFHLGGLDDTYRGPRPVEDHTDFPRLGQRLALSLVFPQQPGCRGFKAAHYQVGQFVGHVWVVPKRPGIVLLEGDAFVWQGVQVRLPQGFNPIRHSHFLDLTPFSRRHVGQPVRSNLREINWV